MTRFRSACAGLVFAATAWAGWTLSAGAQVSLSGPGLPAVQPAQVAGPSVPAPVPAAPQPSAAHQGTSTASPDVAKMRAGLDASRAELEQAEATLRRVGLSGDELQAMRTRIDPIVDRLRGELAAIGPKLDAAKARLDQLGPKPKEGSPPEGADVARDRMEREAGVAEFDEINRLARALLLQAEQLTSQVSDRRRSVFTSALFQRSYGLVSPELWRAAASGFPRDFRALQILSGDAWSRLAARATFLNLLLFGLAVGIGAALYISRKRVAPRLVHRDEDAVGVSPTRKLLTGLGTLAVATIPAAFGSILIYQTASLLDLLPGRLMPVLGAVMAGLAVLAFLQGLVDALFAPTKPNWRLIELTDPAASSIMSLVIIFGIVVVVGKTADEVNQAIAAGLPLSVATKAIAALVATLAIAELLRRLADREDETDQEACLGPYISQGVAVAGPIRMIGWILVAALAVSLLAGYIAFASFLVDQIGWLVSLAGLLYLALAACDRLIGGPLHDGSRVSTTLQANLGVRRKSLQQLGVLGSGLMRVVLVLVATMLALAPWGIESADFTGSLRAAFFGFKVGDVTISLSTTILAVLSFAGVIVATRIVQRWLTKSFLPTTELDDGLQNSIATAAGYVGFFAAAAMSLSYVGLSLEKIAIVAGALSVGIGFGLQSIVNNFVSGLILLWERPIRVGDLIVVGNDGEGYVRRISVRATEVETFDRSTLIIPNSSLISGVVKNRVRGDRTGRVIVPVSVLRNQDPVRAAEILVGKASEHPDILKNPLPRIVFKKIGETWLEFDLICFVDDVAKQLRVQSDLNFALFKALVDEKILPPLGPGAMNVGGLEPVQSALQGIADALSRPDGARSRPGGGPTIVPPLQVQHEPSASDISEDAVEDVRPRARRR